ncbi:MAG TPA: nickel pincer cofactor biosynthesis protein LarB [Gemmatimonadaceae bacterium]|nr:nickel pincer cofactor biosynthesis protein LarB [Gemmatimonadaceae bacterium]
MIRERALALLTQVAEGSLDPRAALDALSFAPAESLAFATIDHHRALRQGYPEVIYAPGKTPDEIVAIAERLAEHGDGFLITRADAPRRAAVVARFPDAESNNLAQTLYLAPAQPAAVGQGTVLIVTAGTSDAPVAEEAAVTARAFGNSVGRATDVGVAGIHRLLSHSSALQEAAVVIVVAGMDGALPSVVGGLVSVPVIAVPTSVGYGASFGGLAALLSMLNSCAAGVTVVNVDNGFGAAVAASRIMHSIANPH